jgi:hypothetical protein
MKLPDALKDLGSWIEGTLSSVLAGYETLREYHKVKKLNKVRVLFITSDYNLWGLNEELYATVNNDEDIARIEGFERLFFGDEKRGIVTYRDTAGMDYIIVSDGDHVVKDSNKVPALFKPKGGRLTAQDIIKLKTDMRLSAKTRGLLNQLKVKDFDGVLDFNIGADHKDSKDLSVWADKVMTHGFFKSLSRFPARTIVLIFLLGMFFGQILHFGFEFFMIFLYFLAKLVLGP